MSAVELPTLPQSLIDLIAEYGFSRTDGVSELERIHRWTLVIAGIKDYAAAYGLECSKQAIEQAALACDDVDEPGWTGYECPNTFPDGVSAAKDAIRALSGPKGQKGGDA